jgi:hypothetical protein
MNNGERTMGKLYSLQAYRITKNVKASEIIQDIPEPTKELAFGELIVKAERLGIYMFKAVDDTYNGIIGIHLLNPTYDEVNNALDRAYKEGWQALVLHGESIKEIK